MLERVLRIAHLPAWPRDSAAAAAASRTDSGRPARSSGLSRSSMWSVSSASTFWLNWV